MILVPLLLIQPGVCDQDSVYDLEPSEPVTIHPVAPFSAPHHCLVFYERVYCSGSLITSKIVLTVASCFHVYVTVTKVSIKYGCKESLDSSGRGKVLKVVEIKEHEYFRYKSELDNDIALLVLERNVYFRENVAKIPLCEPNSRVPEFSHISVTGWGGTDQRPKTQEKIVYQTNMVVMSQTDCFLNYPEVFTNSMFCAKFDASNRINDNGGGAVLAGQLVGISSFGAHKHNLPKDAPAKDVALFTNVTYFYKWIKLNTEKLLTKYCTRETEPQYRFIEENYYADSNALKDIIK